MTIVLNYVINVIVLIQQCQEILRRFQTLFRAGAREGLGTRLSESLPAVYDVGAFRGSLEVVESSYEGEYGMRMVGYTKVGPTSVVKLLYFSSLAALCVCVFRYNYHSISIRRVCVSK